MSTPEPCYRCRFLYTNCLYEDDPSYEAECTKHHILGNKDCPDYEGNMDIKQKLEKIPIVEEIQVNGFCLSTTLPQVLKAPSLGEIPYKISFCIRCLDGKNRQITIRQEDSRIIAYGDFEGLIDFIQYAQEVKARLPEYRL